MKVLLAIDDSKFSEAATQALVAQARPKETEVRVLHVIEPLPLYPEGQSWGYTEPPRPVSEEERKDAEELVERQGKTLSDAGFQVTTAIEHGTPKLVIIDSAREWEADLIILGSHGRKGMERFLMGSVSEAVARHAPCSVQIVRIPNR